MNQFAFIEIFRDTCIHVKEDADLVKQTEHMLAGTRIYLNDFCSYLDHVKTEEPKITVAEDTTFSAAAKEIGNGKKVAVLNFANAYHPGGGVKNGASAQEECLCRCSNLYESLTIPYMIRHYYKWNEKHTGDMGSDRIIYTPGVTVFKSDDYRLLDEEDRFFVDVITCAAPYYDRDKKKPVTIGKLEQVFYDRIRNILEVALSNDVDILILGAFGCGAFHNPPELVARIFRHYLMDLNYGQRFEKVIFAIKKSGEECPNLKAFRDCFE